MTATERARKSYFRRHPKRQCRYCESTVKLKSRTLCGKQECWRISKREANSRSYRKRINTPIGRAWDQRRKEVSARNRKRCNRKATKAIEKMGGCLRVVTTRFVATNKPEPLPSWCSCGWWSNTAVRECPKCGSTVQGGKNL